MSTNIKSIGSSQDQTLPNVFADTQPTANVAPQASENAIKRLAKNAEVGADLQSLHQSLEASVQRLNDMMKDTGRNLNIGLDQALGGAVVTVRNAESGEVIRQIPNEVVVRMAHSIEAFKGWLHDSNA